MNNHNWDNAFPDTPKSFKNKVGATLNHLPDQRENGEMENKTMFKKVSFKKKVVVALAAAMVVGTTVFAAGKVFSITSHGSNIPTYINIPTVEQIKGDFGFNPKLVKEFNNGYTFKGGYTVNNEGMDEQGNSVGKTKELDFEYIKGEDRVSLSMEKGRLGEESEKAVVVDTYNDIKLYYHSYANKFVPANYEMTEQDKQDKASGKYVFSYGSEKIEVSQVQYLDWMQDGIHYGFLGMDSDISQDELVEMAHELINSK